MSGQCSGGVRGDRSAQSNHIGGCFVTRRRFRRDGRRSPDWPRPFPAIVGDALALEPVAFHRARSCGASPDSCRGACRADAGLQRGLVRCRADQAAAQPAGDLVDARRDSVIAEAGDVVRRQSAVPHTLLRRSENRHSAAFMPLSADFARSATVMRESASENFSSARSSAGTTTFDSSVEPVTGASS